MSEVKLSLKIMVDTKAKKVVFAEAGKEFVDFLFQILSLPLATIVKLLSNEEMRCSLQALYKSVENLSADCFKKNVNKDTVLLAKHPVNQPLLSLDYSPPTITYYKCPDHDYGSYSSGVICPHGSNQNQKINDYRFTIISCDEPMQEVKLTWVAPKPENQFQGFVKKGVSYIVSDNLEVKPMSMTVIKSLVTDLDHLVEKDVEFGLKEALALLRASLSTNNVLTTVFLGIKEENV